MKNASRKRLWTIRSAGIALMANAATSATLKIDREQRAVRLGPT